MELKEEKQGLEEGMSFTEPSLNILMVEDNPGDIVILKHLITSTGTNFKLIHASSLKETFARCTDMEFDVILLDLGLPESTSLETLQKIKAFRINSPIVVMTGLDDEGIALAALREGAQDYLVKSKLTSDNILRSIKYSIERKKIQDFLKRHAQQLSVLSSATASLSACEDIEPILKITFETIKLLLDKARVIAIEQENRVSVLVSDTDWLIPWYEEINLHTGLAMRNPIFHLTDQWKEYVDFYSDGKLHEVKGGLHEIFKGTIDRNECLKLEKTTGITNIYAFGFVKAENIYGGGIIFSGKLISTDDINIIETIITQTTLCIHRRSIEKELRLSEYLYKELNKELESKVLERTVDLETANKKLQLELIDRIKAEDALKISEFQLKELNATKDKFFNIVAHDLKNPFTSLIGSSELLYDNIGQLDTNAIHELALILNDSAKSGYAILQNLLDWSRSQTGLLKYNPERINLSNLIEENISNIQLFASNKNIALIHEKEEDIYIVSDKCMINTILRNLLSNAIKFTNRGGNVFLSTKTNNEEVIISVEDNGIGISGDNIDKLFRLDTKYSVTGTENEQGTGLGLKLSKEFVEKEGGRIWVESIVNQGSVFRFSIPIQNK